MKRRLLPVLLALGIGVAGCGGASKTTSTASEVETTSRAKLAATACLNMEEAALPWSKQLIRLSEVHGEDAEAPVLTQLDEESYRVEAAAKQITAALPSAREAVSRFMTSLAAVRSTVGEGGGQLLGAEAEANASVKAVIAACEASTKG